MCWSAFVVNTTRVSHHIIHPILGQGWNVPHLTSEHRVHRDLSNPQVTCWVCHTMTQSSARSDLGWTAISDSCRPSSPPSMPPNPGAAAPRLPSQTSLTMGTVSDLVAKRTQVSSCLVQHLYFLCSWMSPGLSTPASPGFWGTTGAKLWCRSPVSPGLWAWIYCVPGDGCMLPAMVRCDPPRTDGVSDQEATGSGRNALREGTHLPSGKVCGQDPQEALFGKMDTG